MIHMGQTERSLIIILSMHRSGSSLTTGILQALGMSLGPFELLGANSENPHGYFETGPILELSRSVQRLAYGFSEDVPDSPETLARFVDTRGAWDESTTIPTELVERGRSLVQGLVGSGTISGFKDPRTVLLWPFWQQVFAAFPGLRSFPDGAAEVAARDRHELIHPGCDTGWIPVVLGYHRRSSGPTSRDRRELAGAGPTRPFRRSPLFERSGRCCGTVRVDLGPRQE